MYLETRQVKTLEVVKGRRHTMLSYNVRDKEEKKNGDLFSFIQTLKLVCSVSTVTRMHNRNAVVFFM